MLRYLNIFFGILIIIIGFSCATPGSPIGGEKDETPPIPISFSPQNFSTQFKARTIVVKFDENIKLKNLNQQLVISPPMARPDIISNNRTLTIRLQDTLRENSTYVFSFGEAVVDMNEENVLSNFQFVFSTGGTIDSLSVIGEVVDAFTLQPMKNTAIVLVENLDSLGSRSARPLSVAKADADGFFQFDFLREGCFYLAAINDKNNDWTYDSLQEEVAFLLTCVSPQYIEKSKCSDTCSITDSLHVHNDSIEHSHEHFHPEIHQLLMFRQELPQGITKSDFLSNAVVSVEFRNFTKNAEFRILQPDTISLDYHISWDKNKQKAEIFLSKSGIRNLWLYVEDGNFSDTLKLLNTKFQDTLVPPRTILTFGQELPFFDTLKLTFSTPIREIKDTFWLFVGDDTIATPLTNYWFNSSRTQLTFDVQLNERTNHRLIIRDSLFFDNFNQTNKDTLTLRFRTNYPGNYAKLEVTIPNKPDEQCILQVLNEKMDVLEQRIMESNKEIFTTLKSGKYRLRLVVDENRDGRWSPGNLRERRQPEPVFILSKILSLEADWEYDEEWELQLGF
jgi:hypothetical protein